jgi:hypothetical protein
LLVDDREAGHEGEHLWDKPQEGRIMGRREHVGGAGPLAPYATGFREELVDQGYAPGTVSDHLRLMAHLSRWLISQELDVADLTPTVVEQFLEARADEGYARALGLGAVVPILDHLRGLGIAPKPAPVVPAGPIEVLVERYKGYLLAERGLLAGSVRNYVIVARSFLSHRFEATGGTLALEALSTEDITQFVLGECQRCSVGSAKLGPAVPPGARPDPDWAGGPRSVGIGARREDPRPTAGVLPPLVRPGDR